MLLWFGGKKIKVFLVLHTDSSFSVYCFKYLLGKQEGEKGMLRVVWLCLFGLLWQLGVEIPASPSLEVEKGWRGQLAAPAPWKQQSQGKVPCLSRQQCPLLSHLSQPRLCLNCSSCWGCLTSLGGLGPQPSRALGNKYLWILRACA